MKHIQDQGPAIYKYHQHPLPAKLVILKTRPDTQTSKMNEEIHSMERNGKNRKLNRKDCEIKYSPSSGPRISL